MRFVLMILLAFLALAARASEPAASVVYRLDYGGWYTVPVTVNGKGPYDFIIDTGATHTIVFGNLDAIHHFAPSGGPPQRVLGLAASGLFPTHVVGEIALGPAKLSNVVTVVLDEWKVGDTAPYGVLGLDFLERYFVMIDRARGEVRLYDNRTPLEIGEKGWRWTTLKARQFDAANARLFTVDGYVNSRLVRFMIDLGATGTIINKKAQAKIAKTGGFAIVANPRNGATGSRVKGALNEKAEQEPLRVEKIRLGRSTWYRHIIFVHDAPVFGELGVEDEAFGLLGADLFHDRSVAFDFKGERLWIGPR
ncbi:MAG: aspartyl protease family protein [Parvularculaceae bacterium]|nr:aspartyl protease family protein [Parvularculaceae bacterium]